jgi:hypothetical protein
MDYEIAKQLKDAGFPQSKVQGAWWYDEKRNEFLQGSLYSVEEDKGTGRLCFWMLSERQCKVYFLTVQFDPSMGCHQLRLAVADKPNHRAKPRCLVPRANKR